MLRYDLYRSVHKFIRKKLYHFGEELGKTDFRKIAAVIGGTVLWHLYTVHCTGSYYDDYIMIKVNNQLIHTDPDNFNSMECRNYNADRTHCNVYISKNGNFVKASDIGRANDLAQLNLMPHLQNGKNNINTCVGIVGGGTLNVTIKYQLK